MGYLGAKSIWTQNRCLVQLPPYKSEPPALNACRWSGCFFFLSQGFVKDAAAASPDGKLNPHWSGEGSTNGLPVKSGKAGIFLARVRHATVIQMKLNYSGVGPPIYCMVTSAAAREHSKWDTICSSSCWFSSLPYYTVTSQHITQSPTQYSIMA